MRKIEGTAADVLALADCEITRYRPMETFFKEQAYLKTVDRFDTFLYFWHVIFSDLYTKFQGIYKGMTGG